MSTSSSHHFPCSSLILQIVMISGFSVAGERLVHLIRLPIPGAIVGMLFLLVALLCGLLKIDSVKRGARLLLAEMLLFFIPVVLVVLDHREFIGLVGLKILLVTVISTLLVMCSTVAIRFGRSLKRGTGDGAGWSRECAYVSADRKAAGDVDVHTRLALGLFRG